MIAPALLEQLSAALLEVQTPDGQRGTGFLVQADGLALTSAQLVRDFPEVTLRWSHPELEVVARVIAIDLNQEVALLRPLLPVSRHPLGLAAGPMPALGTPVLVVVHPLRVHQGSVAATTTEPERLYIDAALDAHNLGGPVLDQRGLVVGLHSQGAAAETVVIPSSALLAVVARHAASQPGPAALSCPRCGGGFRRDDEQCPSCGVVTPFHQNDSLLTHPERARAARLVSGLLERLGQDPIGTRVAFDRWRVGLVSWALSHDGETLGFSIDLGPTPKTRTEGLYRFLLTYGDDGAHHATMAIDQHDRMVLGFREPIAWLHERAIEARLQALAQDAEQARGLIAQGFGGASEPPAMATEPAAEAFDDGLELP